MTVQDIAVLALFTYMHYANYSHGDDVSAILFSRVNLLFVGYSLLRLLFVCTGPIIQKLVLLAVEAVTCYEAFLALLQIIGVVESNNYLFACTGTFDNPGPLGGFLAVGLCVSSAAAVSIRHQGEANLSSACVRIILWSSYLTAVICAIILPSTQSRAAWLSILVSAVVCCLGLPQALILIKKHWLIILTAILFFLLFVFLFKRPSTNGRLFTYKVELMTIKRTGFNGVGMGHFSKAYGITQRGYFARTIKLQEGELSYQVSDKERIYADNPKVGFNDYLQFGIEYGLGPLILLLLWIVLVLYSLFRSKSPFCYGMISILVFAFFSYPFSLLEFLILILVFAAIAGCKSDEHSPSKASVLFFAFICLIPVAVFYRSADAVLTSYKTERLWKRQRPIFDSGDYRSYEYCCSQLYPCLKYNCAFLYEFAYSLFENGDVAESERLLHQSLELNGNSLSFILLGDIHKKQGLIIEAERDYFNSFLAQPDRLYPLYKLAVLYYDSNQLYKFRNVVRSIEGFHPRIESESTDEIRDLLNVYKYEYEKTM